jgi:hypothetical protein
MSLAGNDNMVRSFMAVLLLSLASCSERSGPQWFGVDGFSGNVELQACGAGASDPTLDRCALTAPSTIAAVCGDLDERNTLTLSTGSLAVAGDWIVDSPAHVGGDVVVGGTLNASNTVTVDGALHATGGDPKYVTAGTVTSSDAQVDDPLACDGAPPVGGAVANAEALGENDLGDALLAHSQPADVSLGCARYRFSSLGIDNQLTFHVTGQTMIVVDGDVRISSPMQVELEPGATLDFLIGGALQIDNTLSFSGGSTWLAVGGEIGVGAPLRLTGFLYAPESQLSVNNTLDVNGSLLVGSMTIASPVTVTALDGPALPACQTTN